jgi:hypothetical protein
MRTGYRDLFGRTPRGENPPVAATAQTVRRVQGAWYLVTGLWPVLSLRTFALVAGPKPDAFQTRTTGITYAAAGVALRPWSQAEDDGATDAVRLLALATSLGTVAVVAAHWRTLRWTLKAEALLELGFALAAGRRTRTYGEKRT